jgi:hypothetical protein
MSRYLYRNGGVIGYMDNSDQYLYPQDGGQPIAYWDQGHKNIYTLAGKVYGYISSDGTYLHGQSGNVIGYFEPRHEEEEED